MNVNGGTTVDEVVVCRGEFSIAGTKKNPDGPKKEQSYLLLRSGAHDESEWKLGLKGHRCHKLHKDAASQQGKRES